MVTASEIAAYIDFLRKAGFTVTLHGKMVNNDIFLRYNYHQNPYCHYVKSVYNSWGECVKRHKKVLEKCEEGAFCGCCYAGVGEFVYPVHHKDRIYGFISVSGYRLGATDAKAEHFARKNGIDPVQNAMLTHRFLDPDPPKFAEVDAVIRPLVVLLETYFQHLQEEDSASTTLYHKILRYVTENCHSKITMADLSREFHYSVSTISHLFSAASGKSLPEYLDSLRIEEAKWYLSNSDTPISEIARFLGYNSGNYFSSVFRKKCGVTPKKFRSEERNRKKQP